jgi:cytochrome c-type biogenesis protein CcmH/NrfG
MKALFRYFPLFLLFGLFVNALQAQSEMSNPSGLPTRIGGNPCNNTGGRAVATITGFLNVTGVSNPGKTPTYSVAVYATGVFISRRRLRNGDSFSFYCVPRENVTLVGEVDSAEVSSLSLGNLSDPPAINRHDVNINWSTLDSKQQTGVVSARNTYERSKENQKLFDQALDEIRAKKDESSIKLLKRVLEKDQKDWAAWSVLGSIYFNTKRLEDAEQAYDQAIELKRDYFPALLGLGRTSLDIQKSDKAIEVLKAAVAIEPTSADVNHYLGEAYFQVRKGSLGIEHMRKAIDVAPNEKADLHLRIAALYNAAGAKHLAADEYKLFLQKRPDYPDRQRMEKYIAENQQ